MIDLKIKTSKDSLVTNGIETVNLFVTVKKVAEETPAEDIYVSLFAKSERVRLYYNQPSQIFDGKTVNNKDWEYYPDSNPSSYVWKYIGDKSVFTSSRLGFSFTYDPQGTSGYQGISFSLAYLGGESNYSNNNDVIAHVWNP